MQPRSGLNIFVISVQPTTGLYFRGHSHPPVALRLPGVMHIQLLLSYLFRPFGLLSKLIKIIKPYSQIKSPVGYGHRFIFYESLHVECTRQYGFG